MKNRTGVVVAFTALFLLVGEASADELIDRCVGGKWDDLLAQSGLVHSRTHPDLGLQENLVHECPAFVNQVLFASSLDSIEKKKVFSEVGDWSHDRTMVFYLKLRLENQKAAEEFWGNEVAGK